MLARLYCGVVTLLRLAPVADVRGQNGSKFILEDKVCRVQHLLNQLS